jgi:DNA topoisomerase VI subunit B
MPEPKLHRTTFSQSRAAEYLDLGTLQKLTGRTADDFPRVVVKELLDNALDAAETAGVGVPHVCVRGWPDGRFLVIEVHDNGVGIPTGVVERALDFSTLTSDKALYRTPTRGQQGNALKTIFGMPYALGASGASPRIWIDSAAGALPHRHGIAVRLGAGEQVEIDHEITPLLRDGLMGTRVTVWLPERRPRSAGSFSEQIADLVRAYHLFNPHAKVSFSWFGSDSDHGFSGAARTPEIAETHHPSVPSAGYRKFMPDDLLVVHWYDVRSFTRLIRSYVSHGEDMPLGEFLAKFRGFTSKPKASAARRAVPDARKLSDLSDANVRVLFGAMCSQVKAPSHAVLGDPLGEEHLVGALHDLYSGEREWYKRIKTTLNGAPAVVEAAVVETSAYQGFSLVVGLNHTPTYTDPLADAYVGSETSSARVGGRGIRGFLRDAKVERFASRPAICVAVHIMAASPVTTDRGKTRLAPDPVFQRDLGKALWSVSKDLYKEAKKRERDALAAERDAERRARRQANTRITKAQACYEVMQEAYAYSTGNEALPTTARDLYYAVRNRIERFGYDADELTYKYFSQDVLPTYRREVSELPLVEYEPRGILYEPHGGKEVRLGTRSVAEYNFPDFLFNKILYIEKNGRVGILQAAQVDRRHDMALIGGQGYASEAIRTLFATAEKGKYQLFVLHDADPHGYGIARTLREETNRMPGYSVDVIDMGLRLGDALAMGKRPETFTRKSRLDEKTEAMLTDLEREHFVGRERKDAGGKPYWIASRVELNDLSSPQLVDYVERKLEEHDALGKVIPPPDALKVRTEKIYRDLFDGWVDDLIDEMLGTDELKESMAKKFEESFNLQDAEAWIEKGFERRDTQSWRDAVKGVLRDAYADKHKDAIQDAVRESIRKTVGDEDEG